MTECATDLKVEIWSAGSGLSGRVKKLREDYFNFQERGFRNEAIPFTTGAEKDLMFSPHNWGVAPEVFILQRSIQDSCRAIAKKVDLPEAFWKEPLVKRQAIFFNRVVEHHLPVRILDGDLIAGFQFNAILSRCLNPEEQSEWEKLEKKWVRSNLFLNAFGIGNCGAIPRAPDPELSEGAQARLFRPGGIFSIALGQSRKQGTPGFPGRLDHCLPGGEGAGG